MRMNGITEKTEKGFYKLKNGFESYGSENGIRLVQIVGKIEDRQEEFGVNLLKLLSARKVYYMDWNANGNGFEIRETYELLINLTERRIEYYRSKCSDFTFDLEFKDYGKKDVYGGWAFTKEELE